MVDLYKQVGNKRIKLTDDEVAEYNALQQKWIIMKMPQVGVPIDKL